MAEQYYTITTNAGDEAIAAALASGTTKTFVYGAVGDGGGNYYELTKDQTVLRGEKWRGNCEVSKDPGNSKRVIVTFSIPSTVGGFQVREAGVFDADGVLMGVSKQPLSDKVAPDSGASKDMSIRLYFEVVDPGAVTVTVDPSAQYVPRSEFDDHVSDTDIHMEVGEKASIATHLADKIAHITGDERRGWNSKASAATYTVSLPASGWTGNGPYTQAVSVAGILADDRPIFGPVYAGTNDEKIEQSIMAGFVSSCETAAGSVTFTALLAKPEVDLTMQLEVIR